MNEPITTLDTRYSEPDGVVTSWEQTRRVLETAELFWLSTVRTDGRPHVTPVVAVWHDGTIHFNSADTSQKVINLRGNPHVILTTGCNRWEEGLDVVVEGEAVRITDHDRLEQLARVWATTRWEDGNFSYATAAFTSTMSTSRFSSSRSSSPRSSRSLGATSAILVTSSNFSLEKPRDMHWPRSVSTDGARLCSNLVI